MQFLDNMKDPLITIAIPIYNAEKYLRYAIQSCINQTYKHWELLLMCDGSTDGSTVIAYEFAKKDDRIKVVNDGENKGMIYRLNQSISLAQGKYYARMDADDIMCITRIERQVTYMIDNPQVDILGASIMTIDTNNNIIGSALKSGKVVDFFHPTVLGKTQWFRENPYADWAIRAEDFELWSRTCSKSHFYSLDEPLLFYRQFGIASPNKYIKTELTALKVTTHYKEYGKPFSWFVKNAIRFSIMALMYRVSFTFGFMDALIKHRKVNPLPQEKCLSQLDLKTAIKV